MHDVTHARTYRHTTLALRLEAAHELAHLFTVDTGDRLVQACFYLELGWPRFDDLGQGEAWVRDLILSITEAMEHEQMGDEKTACEIYERIVGVCERRRVANTLR